MIIQWRKLCPGLWLMSVTVKEAGCLPACTPKVATYYGNGLQLLFVSCLGFLSSSLQQLCMGDLRGESQAGTNQSLCLLPVTQCIGLLLAVLVRVSIAVKRHYG